MLLLALLAPWAANAQEQQVITCYPPTEEYATGYTDGTDKTSGEMHTVCGGGVQGWMKFDVSSIPENATINSISLHFYTLSQTNNCWVKLTAIGNSTGLLDPVTAEPSDLYSAITNPTPNYYTSDHLSGFSSSSAWKTFALSNSAITNLQETGLTNNYFAIGFYEYESGGYTTYQLYTAGYNDANYRPYIEVTCTVPVSCPKPTNLTCTAATGNPTPSATLSWTKGGTETEWVLEYSTASDFTGATTIDIRESDLVNGTYTINSGLTAETKHYARIKANCGGEESNWSDVCEFKPSNVSCDVIGTGSSTATLVQTSYGCTYSQHIYTATELTAMGFVAGDIVSVSFYYSGTSSSNDKTQSIYMGTTTKSSYSSSAASEFESDVTLVYGPQLLSYVAGWREYELTEPFEWDGTSNIVVGMLTNATNGSSSGWSARGTSTDQDYRTIYRYQDYTPIDITNLASVQYGNYATTRPNINFCILSSNTPKPRNLAVMDGSLSSSGATLQWTEPSITPNSYEYQYKKATVTDWPTAWTTNNTNLSVALTLDPGTTYDFRVRAVYSEGESDPVEIQFTTLDNCAFPTNLIADITPGQGTKATFSWTKGFSEDNDWVLQYGTDNTFATYTEITDGFTVVGNTVSFAATTGITPEVLHYARVKTDCGGTSSTWSDVAEFTPTNFVDYTYNSTATSSTSYNPFYGYYANNATNQSQFVIPAAELAEIAGGTIRSITYYTSNTTTTTDWGGVIFDVYMAEVENSTFSSATFVNWDDLTNVYTGTVSLSNGMMTITFDQEYTYNGGNLLIGFKTNTPGTATQSISWRASYRSNEYNTVYQYSTNDANRTYYFPQITFNYRPTAFVRVTEINEGTITTNSAELTWTAPSENATSYAYQYKKATAAEWPTDWTNTTATTATLSPLDHSTTYNFRIKALYPGNHESAVTTISFNTACDVVATFPWRENFESYAANASSSYAEAYKFNDPCWVNVHHLDGTGTSGTMTLFQVCSYTQTGNSTNKLELPDMKSGTQTKLRLPEMNLPGNNYQFTINVLRNTSGSSYTSEGVRVYASTDGEIEGATELGFLYRNCEQTDGGVVTAESSEDWYTYEFPIPFSGTCYIILLGESQYGSATYMDNLAVEQIPTCRKPMDLAYNNSLMTAHTATLSWTNGAEGQNAWQIAYSTNSSFAPTKEFTPNGTDEWLADVTSNPGQISGLNQHTTYYAYVRANCGSVDGVSDWCVAPISFTTLFGNLPPTDMEVAGITDEEATVSWTGVATNVLHQSYELYYAVNTTENPAVAPEPTTTPSIIGINATSKLINGLSPLTEYYVWVRDNCGTDGNSDWVGPEIFTTEASCMVPNTLAISGVTAHNASLNWNGNSDSYTLRYRKAITVPVNFDETYDFEDGTMQGWTVYDEDGDGNSWSVENSEGNNGAKCMRARYTGSSFGAAPQNWLISPEIPLGGTLRFYAKRYNGGSGENFQVFVSTTGTDISDFNAISEVTPGQTAYTLYEYDLSSYSGNGYVAIKHTAANDQWYLYVDDITYTNTIPGVYDEWQTVNNAAKPYPFTDLEADTYYEVQVNGHCNTGNITTDWSEPITFTTTIACPAPTNLTYANLGQHTVDLTWNVNDNPTTNYVLTKNGTPSNIVVTIDEGVASYTLQNLDGETEYTVSVVANCGTDDGTSLSSNEVTFTTLVSCAKPTDLEAIDITRHEATLTWDGTASSYNVRYRVLTAGGATQDFESGVGNWTTIDADGDGYTWILASDLMGSGSSYTAHNSSADMICSESYSNTAGTLTPDNYLVSPLVALGGSISFYACAQDQSWAAEHFGVAVSTISNTDPDAFTILNEWTMTAAGTPAGAKDQGQWGLYTVDLSAFAGQTGYVAIRHFNCTDYFYLNVDDIVITAPDGSGEPAEWTTVENVTTNSIDVDELAAGTLYEFEVQAICGAEDGNSRWVHSSFATEIACQPVTDLAVTATTSTSATITWNAGTGSAWQVYLYDNNDNVLSGYPVDVTNATCTFNGLTANTPYKAGVKNNCGGVDISAEVFVNLRTDCNIITSLPYEEGFEGAESYCWTLVNFEVANIAGYAHTDNFYLYSNGYNETHMAIQPEMNAEISSLVLNFWYMCHYESSYETLKVGYLTDVNDYSSFVEVGEIQMTAANNDVYTQSGDFFFTGAPAGSRIAFNYVSSGNGINNRVYIDDVKILEPSTVTKNIVANNWYALSSPVNTPNVTDVNNLTVGTYDFYRYDESSSTWENYKHHNGEGSAIDDEFTTFENGRGYIYRRSNGATLTFTGVPNNSVSYTFTAERTDDLQGFNLLGNPYTTDYNYSGVCYNLTEKGTWKVNATSYTIPVCEAVLVQVDETAPFNFPINTSKSAPKAAQTLALTVNGNGYEDVTYAMLEEGKGLNKVAHLAEDAPALSIPVDGSNYAIAYLGYEVESFPLTLNATAGEYTIALNNQNSGLSYCHLLDKVTGKETDLLKGAYTFKANGNSDRFTVMLTASQEGEIAIWNGNSWIVNGEGTLQVFDVMGRRVYNQEVAGQSSLNTDELATGVYVIRLGEKSQKIVVK